MGLEERKLPVGVQSFEKIIENQNIYVDKTEYIYKLVNTNVPYFLSRPRRFGKSLLLSTMKAYWEGKKELFKGLKIEELEQRNPDAWQSYPVFYFDFNGKNYQKGQALETILDDLLSGWELSYQVAKENGLEERFKKLLRAASEKTGKRCVVLVDEYDKPLIETMDNKELVEHNKAVFKGFFSSLKSEDANIRFIFITGVTKFSKVSIFSDLNNLKDISLDNRYADICGLTKNELMNVFQPEIEAMSEENNLTYEECLAKLKQRYDGYHFSSNLTDIYNPYCLLNALDEKSFGSYWFESGTPTFLIKMIRRMNFDVKTIMKGFRVALNDIADYRLSYTNVVPMMYQSGYLTIKEYKGESGICTLGYPNEEVEYAFMNKLLGEFSYLEDDSVCSYQVFADYIHNGQVEEFMTAIKAIFAHIPYPTAQKKYELDYQTIFYLIFTLMGQIMRTEVVTFSGRIDAVCETKDYVYLFEFKLDGSVDDALKQIEDKDYAVGYEASGKSVVKIGVAFDTEKRNIADWKMI